MGRCSTSRCPKARSHGCAAARCSSPSGRVAARCALVVGAVGVLVRVPAASQAGSQETVPPPSGFLPRPAEQRRRRQRRGGGARRPIWITNGDTTAHDTNSTVPYTEQVDGQEVYLTHPEEPGGDRTRERRRVEPRRLRHPPYAGDAFPRFLGGSCGDLMVGDQGEYGGIGFCLHTGETAPDAAFAMAGFGNDLDRQADPIIGYAGLVDSQVATVELRLAGGDTTTLPLYDAPAGDRRAVLRGLRPRQATAGASWPWRPTGRSSVRAGSASTRPQRPDQHRLRPRARGRELGRDVFRGTAGINAVIRLDPLILAPR